VGPYIWAHPVQFVFGSQLEGAADAAVWCAGCCRVAKPGDDYPEHPLFHLRLCKGCHGDLPAGQLLRKLDTEGDHRAGPNRTTLPVL
jgi:hypothetical protein